MTLGKLADIQDNLHNIVTDNNVKVRLSTEMADSTHIIARVMRTVVLLKDPSLKEHEMVKINKAHEAYNKAWAELEKIPPSEQGKVIRKKISDAHSAAVELNNRLIERGMANKEAEATTLLLKEVGSAVQKLQDALDENIVS